MLKVKYWPICCDIIFLIALVVIVSFDRAYKEVSTKKYWKKLWLSFCEMTFKKQRTVPVTLTFDGQFCVWIDYDPISVLYGFQIDISTNNREIKYRNIEIWA